MKKLIFLFCILPLFNQAQLTKSQVKRLSDSLIIAHAGQDFYSNLSFEDCSVFKPLYKRTPEKKFSININPNKLSEEFIIYHLGYFFGDEDCFVSKKPKGSSRCFFSIRFFQINNRLYADDGGKFNLFGAYIHRLNNSNTITESQAIQIGQKYFPADSKESRFENKLIYNQTDDTFYWIILRESGDQIKYNLHSIYIDAIKGRYIKTEVGSFR